MQNSHENLLPCNSYEVVFGFFSVFFFLVLLWFYLFVGGLTSEILEYFLSYLPFLMLLFLLAFP